MDWRTDYVKARQEAQEKSRPLVIDCTKQDCVWCRQLELRTFADPDVAALLRERFVPLRLDAERNGELIDKLHVQSFPTLLFAGPDGRVLGFQEGFVEPGRFRELLQKALGEDGKPASDSPSRSTGTTAAREGPPPAATPVSRSDAGEQASRRGKARDLLAQAREDHQTQQYLSCLDHCEALAAHYGDLPEAAEAAQLARDIKSNPEWAKKTCDQMVDRLASLYLGLAETLLHQGKPQQAVFYLEMVIQTCPNSRHVEAAQARLSQIQGAPAREEDDKK